MSSGKDTPYDKERWGAALAMTLLLILIGAGNEIIGNSIAIFGIGLFLFIWTPNEFPGRLSIWLAMGLLFVGLSGLIPQFSLLRPDWWLETTKLGIELPITRAPQPLKVIESWILLLAGVGWFYLLQGWNLHHRRRRQLLWILVGVSSIFALVLLISEPMGWRFFMRHDSDITTFFANRNQTAIFFAVICMLSYGMIFESLVERDNKIGIAVIALIISFAALLHLESRAGIILFFLGAFLWTMMHLNNPNLKIAIKAGLPLLIIMGSLFLFLGSNTLERIKDLFGLGFQAHTDMRMLVYQDAINIILAQPIVGSGLGQFDAIFPFFRDNSRDIYHALHPESDWLWLTAETGLIGLFIITTALIVHLKKLIPRSLEKHIGYRTIAACGFITFLLHTLIDVSAHRIGTFCFGTLLYALARRKPDPRRTILVSASQRRIMQGCSIFLMGSAAIWLLASATDLPLHHEVTERVSAEGIEEAIESNDLQSALTQYRHKALWEPLAWETYFERARIALYLENDIQSAETYFTQSRHLSKANQIPALTEGKIWLQFNKPDFAITAWSTAIERTKQPDHVFREMLQIAYAADKSTIAQMWEIAQNRSVCTYLYLTHPACPDSIQRITNLIRKDSQLSQFTNEQREKLYMLYAQAGFADSVIQIAFASADSNTSMWQLNAYCRARLGDYRAAAQIADSHFEHEELQDLSQGRSLDSLTERYYSNPSDILIGIALLQKQIKNEMYDNALITAEKLYAQKNAPMHVKVIYARLLERIARYEASWQVWTNILKLPPEK